MRPELQDSGFRIQDSGVQDSGFRSIRVRIQDSSVRAQIDESRSKNLRRSF